MFFAFWGDRACVRGGGYSSVVSNGGVRVCSYGGDGQWGDVLGCGSVSVGGDDVVGSGGVSIGRDGVMGPSSVTVGGAGDVVEVEVLSATGVVSKSSWETFGETRDQNEGYGSEGVAFSTTISTNVRDQKDRSEDVRVFDSLKDPQSCTIFSY